MVGHANILDRILDEIDEIDSEVVLCDAADGSSTAEAHSASSASSDSSPLTNNIRPISIMWLACIFLFSFLKNIFTTRICPSSHTNVESRQNHQRKKLVQFLGFMSQEQ